MSLLESALAARNSAVALDRCDPLAAYREEFALPGASIYLDGNSLGPLSRRADAALARLRDEWRDLGVGGWTRSHEPWATLSERLGARTASLVGADGDEVVLTGSTSLNLHQMVATLFRPSGQRRRILATALDFPSDVQALRSQLALRGLDPYEDLVLVPSRDGHTVEESDIVAAMRDDVAMAVLPTVLYRSGQLLDVASLTRWAHDRGILIGFDAAHSIGVVPHHFTTDGVDFAVWCGYKYLNGGPGAPGGLYVNRRHFGTFPGLAGWFGSVKSDLLGMGHDLNPQQGAGGYQIGTPHLLSMAPLAGSVDLLAEAGINRIRTKSLRITRYLVGLLRADLGEHDLKVITPMDDHRRGGHIALAHPDAARLAEDLRIRGVVADHRPPDLLRFTPSPLYTSYLDVWEAMRTLRGLTAADRKATA